ncbi:hypothetical protein D3C76_1224160 [compost metagenome]
MDGDQLTISMQEKNGKLLDQYSIDKAKGTGTPAEELPKIQIDKVDKLSAFEEKKKVGDTVSVFAEVNAANVTNYVGRGVHILAQLGYKKDKPPIRGSMPHIPRIVAKMTCMGPALFRIQQVFGIMP